MANTIGFGQAAVNNTIDYGQGATDNTINWGKSQTLSPGGETNITGAGGTPAFTNTLSTTFDGVDTYVDIADNSNLSFGNGTTDSPFSISAWVKLGSTSLMGIVSKYGSSSSTREWLFYTNAGKPRILLIDKSNSTNAFAEGNTALSTNTFYHVACTYDGRGGSTAYQGLNIYVNGVLQSLTLSGTSYTAMHNTTQPVEIGKYQTLNFEGNIDEVSLFNTELSQSDITSIYGSGVPTSLSTYASLISWWRMGDGDTYPTITDNKGSNDGTMQAMSSANFVTDVPT